MQCKFAVKEKENQEVGLKKRCNSKILSTWEDFQLK
jgi:hypothetical protein